MPNENFQIHASALNQSSPIVRELAEQLRKNKQIRNNQIITYELVHSILDQYGFTDQMYQADTKAAKEMAEKIAKDLEITVKNNKAVFTTFKSHLSVDDLAPDQKLISQTIAKQPAPYHTPPKFAINGVNLMLDQLYQNQQSTSNQQNNLIVKRERIIGNLKRAVENNIKNSKSELNTYLFDRFGTFTDSDNKSQQVKYDGSFDQISHSLTGYNETTKRSTKAKFDQTTPSSYLNNPLNQYCDNFLRAALENPDYLPLLDCKENIDLIAKEFAKRLPNNAINGQVIPNLIANSRSEISKFLGENQDQMIKNAGKARCQELEKALDGLFNDNCKLIQAEINKLNNGIADVNFNQELLGNYLANHKDQITLLNENGIAELANAFTKHKVYQRSIYDRASSVAESNEMLDKFLSNVATSKKSIHADRKETYSELGKYEEFRTPQSIKDTKTIVKKIAERKIDRTRDEDKILSLYTLRTMELFHKCVSNRDGQKSIAENDVHLQNFLDKNIDIAYLNEAGLDHLAMQIRKLASNSVSMISDKHAPKLQKLLNETLKNPKYNDHKARYKVLAYKGQLAVSDAEDVQLGFKEKAVRPRHSTLTTNLDKNFDKNKQSIKLDGSREVLDKYKMLIATFNEKGVAELNSNIQKTKNIDESKFLEILLTIHQDEKNIDLDARKAAIRIQRGIDSELNNFLKNPENDQRIQALNEDQRQLFFGKLGKTVVEFRMNGRSDLASELQKELKLRELKAQEPAIDESGVPLFTFEDRRNSIENKRKSTNSVKSVTPPLPPRRSTSVRKSTGGMTNPFEKDKRSSKELQDYNIEEEYHGSISKGSNQFWDKYNPSLSLQSNKINTLSDFDTGFKDKCKTEYKIDIDGLAGMKPQHQAKIMPDLLKLHAEYEKALIPTDRKASKKSEQQLEKQIKQAQDKVAYWKARSAVDKTQLKGFDKLKYKLGGTKALETISNKQKTGKDFLGF